MDATQYQAFFTSDNSSLPKIYRPTHSLAGFTSTWHFNTFCDTGCICLVLQAATSVVIITMACTPNFIIINEYSAIKF